MASRKNPTSTNRKLGRVLGRGGFGKVQMFHHTTAMKSIDISSYNAEEKVKKKADWEREVKALKKAHGHDNIVEYLNSSSVDDTLYVEMEYCNGGTLNDYVIEKKPGIDVKHLFMIEISSAIAFLHELRVVHRDLKPENIMIRIDRHNSLHAKVADFGLAKVITSDEGNMLKYYLTTGCGTEYFMAPEVYKEKYTEKADVFFMWVIFYAMMSPLSLKKFGNKRMLMIFWEESNGQHTPVGRHMNETGKGVEIGDSDAEIISAKAVSLLNSMSVYNYADRPSAAQVNATLRSLSPKEF